MEPLISVILPIYNMEDCLVRCLGSILNNTFPNLEVICVDDGSRDSSLKILLEYEQKDSRIRVISKENGGVSSARNAGLDLMTGQYVSFVDPDDYIHPQLFEFLFRALQESQADFSICGFHRVIAEGAEIYREPITFDSDAVQEYSVSQIFRNRQLRTFCWGKLFRSDLVSNIRFREDIQYAEDTVFFYEVCEHILSVKGVGVPYVLYYYVQRENSLSRGINLSQHMSLARFWVHRLRQPNSREDICLEQAVKRCLACRYMATKIQPDQEVASECKTFMKELRQRLWKTKWHTCKERLVLIIFIQFPMLYRFFRIIDDPSMWELEKAERKKRLNDENNHT